MKSVISFVLLFNLLTACIHGLVVEEVETEKCNEAEKVYPGVEELCLGAHNGTEFRCSSGEYIPREHCCDGEVDCDDWSDEAMNTCDALNKKLVCPDDMLVCSTSFQCYYPEYHCDGLTDCFDFSDEANCTEKIEDQEEDASQGKDKDKDEDGDKAKDNKNVATPESTSTKVDPKTTTIPATTTATSTIGVTTQKLVTAKIQIVPVGTSKVEVNVPKKCLKKPSKKKCTGLVPHIASKMPKKKVQQCLKKPTKKSCKNIKIVLDFIQNCQENPIDKDCNIIGNTFENIGKTKKIRERGDEKNLGKKIRQQEDVKIKIKRIKKKV